MTRATDIDRRHLLALGVASAGWALAGSALAKPSDPSAQAVADRVQAFYEKVRTYRADFRQRIRRPAHDSVTERSGRVAFTKPGKMSWRFEGGSRIVSDGRILRAYVREERTLYEMALDASPYPAALAFLLGDGNLAKTYELRLLDAKRLGAKGAHVVDCVPRNPTPAYQRLVLYVDAKRHHVRRAALIDAERNINRFDFVRSKINVLLPKDEFTFFPPAGTRIVRV